MTQTAFDQKYPNYQIVPTKSDLFKGFELYKDKEFHLFKVSTELVKKKIVKNYESYYKNAEMGEIEKYLLSIQKIS